MLMRGQKYGMKQNIDTKMNTYMIGIRFAHILNDGERSPQNGCHFVFQNRII